MYFAYQMTKIGDLKQMRIYEIRPPRFEVRWSIFEPCLTAVGGVISPLTFSLFREMMVLNYDKKEIPPVNYGAARL